jgi:hypothetical protein
MMSCRGRAATKISPFMTRLPYRFGVTCKESHPTWRQRVLTHIKSSRLGRCGFSFGFEVTRHISIFSRKAELNKLSNHFKLVAHIWS